ncbi:MAG: GldG family protein [bacterium]|nr:GldG family protein [bacterium]
MRKAAQISQNTIEIIIIIGIVIVLNILGQYFYSRLDLTEDHIYTLASSSKEVVSSLPDLVHIKVYVSEELPPVLQNEDQKLRDLLEEYRASASSKLDILFLDPAGLSEAETGALNQKGIQSTQVQITNRDELSVQDVWMGMEISYLDKYEVIPFVPSSQNLEYDITSAILKLTSDETPTIGFLTGHGEMNTESSQYQQAPLSKLTEQLKELYVIQDVDLGNGTPVPDNISTLVIAAPSQPFTDRHRYVIDQFLMRGGKLVVMGTGFEMDQMSQDQAIFKAFPLDGLLSEYGVKINNDMLVDLQFNHKIPMSMGQLQVYGDYPLIPIISPPDGFPSDSPVTRGLEQLFIPYGSSITLLYDKIPPPEEMTIYELCKTSTGSYAKTLPTSIDPNQDFMPPGGQADLQKQLVAVQLSGIFNSAFTGQPVPVFDPDPNAAEGAIPQMDDKEMVAVSVPTSLTVIGCSTLVDDNTIVAPGNAVFFQNLMESLNIGDKLIDIRTRTVKSRPLNPDLTPNEKNGFKFWGYFFVPILITILGTGRFYLKSQRKRFMATIHAAEKEADK